MTGEVFKLHVLPAGIGDALVLDYGTADVLSRVVIDGGVGKTAGPLASFLGPTPKIEMLMITHVDNDHIAGALKMLKTGSASLRSMICGSTASGICRPRRWRAWAPSKASG